MRKKPTVCYSGDYDYGKLPQLYKAIVEHHSMQRQRQLYDIAMQWDDEQIQDTQEPLREPIRN